MAITAYAQRLSDMMVRFNARHTSTPPPPWLHLMSLVSARSKQALKVLETYWANVQRQGSGRIQNKAAYLMSLIQSYKLGPMPGAPGSAQRLVERLSPAVRRAVEGVFDPVVDRVVLEDRALMELLAKVPEEQVRAPKSSRLSVASCRARRIVGLHRASRT